MKKTTAHLSGEPDIQLEPEDRPKHNAPLPVFHSGRSRSADQMDEICQHIKQRVGH